MKLLVKRSSVTGLLRWSQRALVAGAIVALGYCGFVLIDSWRFQRDESRAFERLVSAGSPAAPRVSLSGTDGLVGRIEVRRLGVSAMVVEGTTAADLRRAAGHIRGTGLPGVPGNVGIAAHRDTFFRPLRNIRKDDIITLTTIAAEYRYRVVSTKIVPPGEASVLNSGNNEILTLVTCYPFYFIGSAPDRFIVRAERVL